MVGAPMVAPWRYPNTHQLNPTLTVLLGKQGRVPVVVEERLRLRGGHEPHSARSVSTYGLRRPQEISAILHASLLQRIRVWMAT